MTNKLQPLPAYEDPPVSEVAISVQFEPLKGFNTVHGGLLWSRFRDRFPRVEQHAPLERTVERTGVRASQQLGLSFLSGPEMTPRLWMLNQDSTELIQIQTDRFIRNWRRTGAGKKQYPRYESHLRPEFLRDFDEFQAFIESEGMGKTIFDQCEITYVNQIRANSVWHGPAEIEKAFVGWSAEYRSRMSHALEGVGIRARHTLQDERGEFLGRLFVELDTGVTLNPAGVEGDGQQVLLLKLIARGRPLGSDLEGVMRFMDLGHREIVLAFDRLTTDQMHSIWRKTQ